MSRYDTPEKLERHRLRQKAFRDANRAEYNAMALARRRAKGMMPRQPALPIEEIKRRNRERYHAQRAELGFSRRVLLTQDQRKINRLESAKRHREKNRDKIRAASLLGREAKKSKQREYNKTPAARKSRALYAMKNPGIIRAASLRRSAREVSQLHPNHDREKEAAICALAIELTRQTGIRHDVDHIIPLSRGGWHHHENLQVMAHDLNIQKMANPFWEQAPYKCWRDVPEFLWPDRLADEYNAMKYGIAI